ncbi:sodium-independent sulfate anion transporter isoform X2 [Ixodes scapularis]|uniref:sodium-independent sulfate anion transporter isoform X2 n=1 Tax=Ixodes scapularis TaxID=6945 RepID=UPI001A9E2D27|nr:sodium-independent sulfate anion transporter isoform X2 [Ixodes scapularis]
MVLAASCRKVSTEIELDPMVAVRDPEAALKIQNGHDRLNDDSTDNEGANESEGFTCGALCGTARDRCCSVRRWKDRVPIVKWLPKYSLLDLHGDFVAGMTVALTVIPQGLALADLAKLPIEYGLYTAFMGGFMYAIFGSCKDLTIGPTAIMSIMTAEYVKHGGPTYAVILTFLSGIIQILMGVLNLGFIVEFISGPVISGFTSAAAITIASTQLESLFGMKFEGELFYEIVYQFFTHLHTVKLGDSLLGVSSVILLLVVRHFKDCKFSQDSRLPPRVRKVIETAWWTIATARNAIVVLACAILASCLLNIGMEPFDLTKEVQGGLPSFRVPDFSANFNGTNSTTIHKDFFDIVQELGSGIPIIALLSILESVAIAKAFAKGKTLDSTQEMMAIGICNLMGSFVSAYPGTGSFSRTAINNNSGVRTPMGGVFTGTIVIMALVFMAPYFKFIPKASLAAIIITAVIFMIHYQDVPGMWRTNKIDLFPFTATFLVSFVLGLEYGIIAGVVISLALLMYEHARPRIRISRKTTLSGVPYLLVSPDRSVLYPSSMYTSSKITKALPEAQEGTPRFVVYDGAHIGSADYTTAVAFKSLSDNFSKQQATLIYVNLKPSVADAMKGALPTDFHHCKSEKELDALIAACMLQWKGVVNEVVRDQHSASGDAWTDQRRNSSSANDP